MAMNVQEPIIKCIYLDLISSHSNIQHIDHINNLKAAHFLSQALGNHQTKGAANAQYSKIRQARCGYFEFVSHAMDSLGQRFFLAGNHAPLQSELRLLLSKEQAGKR
jgi:hypothetical protein